MVKKTKKTETPDEKEIVEETTKELFKLLGVAGDLEISKSDEVIDVILKTEESGIVIGYHGEILESLQLILSLCVSKKLGRFVRLSLEIGDYKKNRIDWLENLAFHAKERVLQEGREVPLSNLKSWERRIVHMLFQDDKEVTSESVGEGKDRTLVIKPRS